MIANWIEWKLRIKLNRSKQIAKKGIKLNYFINIEYWYIWLGIKDFPKKLATNNPNVKGLRWGEAPFLPKKLHGCYGLER